MKEILEETGLDVAYNHFSKKDNISPPFIIYEEDTTENFMADDKTYQDIQSYSIYLVTKIKDKAKEQTLEQVLNNHYLPYEKVNETFINEENIFQVTYEISDICEETTYSL